MTRLARDHMLKFIMKQAWSIRKEAAVSLNQALEIAWAILRFGTPIRFTKTAGVCSGDGQKILRMLVDGKVRFFVRLKRESFNVHDSNAIAVYVVVSVDKVFKVGYINATRASSLAYEMDAGKRVIVLKAEITGDEIGKQYLGLNLKFVVI